MKTVNFKQFKMFTSIEQNETVEVDVRKEFAGAVYDRTNGIVARDLAHRIYRETEPITIEEEEEKIIRRVAADCSPRFMDSLDQNIIDTPEPEVKIEL